MPDGPQFALIKANGRWSFPKGNIEKDETPEVTALREIAEETVKPKELQEAVVTNLQKVRIDEEDETEELASISEAAEARRAISFKNSRETLDAAIFRVEELQEAS